MENKQAEKVIVKIEVLNQIVQYLVTKPFNEVAGLIENLQKSIEKMEE